MAIVITDFDVKFNPIRKYYRMAPFETTDPLVGTGKLGISRVESITKPTFESILDKMIALGKKESDFVIVCHGDCGLPSGSPCTGGMVRVPLNSSTNIDTSQEVLAYLREFVIDNDDPAAASSANFSEAESVIGVDERVFRSVAAKLIQVRALNLNSVNFRACEIGANDELLNELCAVLGPAWLTAPKVSHFYISVTPEKVSDLQKWLNKPERSAAKFLKDSDGKERCAIAINTYGTRAEVSAATTEPGCLAFFVRWLTDSAAHYHRGEFSISFQDVPSTFRLGQDGEFFKFTTESDADYVRNLRCRRYR